MHKRIGGARTTKTNENAPGTVRAGTIAIANQASAPMNAGKTKSNVLATAASGERLVSSRCLRGGITAQARTIAIGYSIAREKITGATSALKIPPRTPP